MLQLKCGQLNLWLKFFYGKMVSDSQLWKVVTGCNYTEMVDWWSDPLGVIFFLLIKKKNQIAINLIYGLTGTIPNLQHQIQKATYTDTITCKSSVDGLKLACPSIKYCSWGSECCCSSKMGLPPSKIEDDKVLVLCQKRKRFVREALDGRCALAASHHAYILSLRETASLLRKCFEPEVLKESFSNVSAPLFAHQSCECWEELLDSTCKSNCSIFIPWC